MVWALQEMNEQSLEVKEEHVEEDLLEVETRTDAAAADHKGYDFVVKQD